MDSIVRLLREGGKVRVALDMDNASVDLTGATVPIMNRLLGTSCTAKEMNSSQYWMEKKLHLYRSFYWEVYDGAWADYRSMRPLIAKQELSALSRSYRVDFITAKESHKTMPYVFNFIAMHFPGHRGAIIEVDLGESKTALGHRLFVDDAPRLTKAVEKEEGGHIYLVRGASDGRYGYNSYIRKSPRVTPVRDTHLAVSMLLELARQAERPERAMISKSR